MEAVTDSSPTPININRIPLELLYNILGLVVPCAMLPQPDATFAQSLALFSAKSRDQLGLEYHHRLKTLRLVCCLWNDVVKAIQPVAVCYNFDTEKGEAELVHFILPRLSQTIDKAPYLQKPPLRLEAWTETPCPSSIPIPQQNKMYEGGSQSEGALPVGLPDLTKVEVFIAKHYNPIYLPTLLLDRMPSLKALSGGLEWLFTKDTPHPLCQWLTHLELHFDWAMVQDVPFLYFESLKVLALCISDLDEDERTPRRGTPTLATWASFPALRHLSIRVDVDPGRIDELIAFLTKVGGTLESLILDSHNRLEEVFARSKKNMWHLFPALVTFGPALEALTSTICPPPKPLTMILGFSDQVPEIGKSRQEDPLGVLINACKTWRTNGLVMLETWQEAEKVIPSAPRTKFSKYHLPKQDKFYRGLISAGFDVRDRNGTSIKDPQGIDFRQTLRIWRGHSGV